MNQCSSCRCRHSFKVLNLISFVIIALAFSAQAFATGGAACGNEAEADIVIMLDRTGSVGTTDMNNEQNGAKALLHFFESAITKPQVAIGSFNVESGPDARIHASLTQTYGVDDTETPPPDVSTGLFEAINDLDDSTSGQGSGQTDVSAALAVAKAELDTNGTAAARYIIIISDGIANRPSGSDPNSCSGGNPGVAANAAAAAAEAAGYQIITIHYGDDGSCASGTGVNFLQNQIATTPALFFEGNNGGDLSGVFEAIANTIVCDDANACTSDTCDNGTCVFTPIGTDSDNDGVPDCADQCPGGDDRQLGDPCTATTGTCSNDGHKICVVDHIECDAQPPIPQDEVCDGMDNDCDGMIDEGFHIGETCMVGTGACMNTGQYVCDGLNANKCNVDPGNPGQEVCNGIDDDCDGQIDEDIAPSGSCDNGEIGACHESGQYVCVNGQNVCNAPSGNPGQEVCNGIDDDCNGQVDDGIPPSGSCSAGTGACEDSGQFVCVQGQLSCNATPGDPGTEVCNGIDDDCDGQVDNNVPDGGSCSAGVGACARDGQFICQDGQEVCTAQPADPTTEICDGIDNDCDGQVDEDNVCNTCDGVVDACGVCNGDGSSCSCVETDLSGSITELDTNSLDLHQAYATYAGKVALKQAKRGLTKKSFSQVKAIVDDILNQTKALYVENWEKANIDLPPQTFACGEQILCVSVSTVSTKDQIVNNAAEIVKLIKQLGKKTGITKVHRFKNIVKDASKTFDNIVSVTAAFPNDVSVNCS